MLILDDRFQFQPWYIKLWRYRWYLKIPFDALRLWWYNRNSNRKDGEKLSWKHCWSIAKGSAQCPMKWYYTWDECQKRMYQRYKIGGSDVSGEGCQILTELKKK